MKNAGLYDFDFYGWSDICELREGLTPSEA